MTDPVGKGGPPGFKGPGVADDAGLRSGVDGSKADAEVHPVRTSEDNYETVAEDRGDGTQARFQSSGLHDEGPGYQSSPFEGSPGTKQNPIVLPHPRGEGWPVERRDIATTALMDDILDAIVTTDPAFRDRHAIIELRVRRGTYYRLGDGMRIAFDVLERMERAAAGFDAYDIESLSATQIAWRWRRRLFQTWPFVADPASPPGSRDNPYVLRAEDDSVLKMPDRIDLDFINSALEAVARVDPEYSGKNGILNLTSNQTTTHYMLDCEMVTLFNLMRLEREASGRGRSDSTASVSDIVRRWKRHLLKKRPFEADPTKPLGSRDNPIILDSTDRPLSIPEPMNLQFIDDVLSSIAERDPRCSEEGTTPEDWLGGNRCYLIGCELVDFKRLDRMERMARGARGDDRAALSGTAIRPRWRRYLSEKKSFKPRPGADLGGMGNPIILRGETGARLEIPAAMSVEFVRQVVRAIVNTDPIYMEKNGVLKISGTTDVFVKRYYLLDGRLISLGTVARWDMDARGVADKKDNKNINYALRRVRKYALTIRPFVADAGAPLGSKENPIRLLKEDGEDFDVPAEPTQDCIDSVLRAILRQDPHYSGNARFSGERDAYVYRYYFLDDRIVTLSTLDALETKARGLGPHAIPIRAVMEDWNRRVAGIDSGTKKIGAGLNFSSPPALEEIDRAVLAIVAEDHDVYPEGDGGRMASSLKYLSPRYRFGDWIVTLRLLAAKVRAFKGKTIGQLPDAAIIADWRVRLFGAAPRSMTRDEFVEWMERNSLSDILSLSNNASSLEDLVRALAPGMSEGELACVMRAFAELSLSGEWQFKAPPPGATIASIGDPLIRAMMMRREVIEMMDGERIERLISASKKYWQRAFNSDPSGTIVALGQTIEETDDPRIRYILQCVLASFRATLEFDVATVRSELKPFQREGAAYLAGRGAAMLSDEPGLGKTIQAIAAAESLRGEGGKVLVISPATAKETWRQQLSTDCQYGHLNCERNVVVVEGDRARRRELALGSRQADYVVVNFEYLVTAGEDEIEAMTAGMAVKIVDEAQMIQNPSDEVKRAAAVRRIKSPRTWYLTATPYFAHPENIWAHLNDLEPGRHGTLAEFRAAHTGDEMGLVTLNRRLQRLMLRRRKADVLGTYDRGVPLDGQALLLPEKRWVDPAAEGQYMMSEEQQAASLLLLTDFDGFWDEYGDGERIASEVSPLEKVDLLFKITHQPGALGINGLENKYAAMDRIVEERIARGEKVVIYTNRRSEVRHLAERYSRHGVVTYTGDMSEAQRERARCEFQDGGARIIIGTEAMRFSIDLTAADALIFAQMPFTYAEFYQIADRLQRLDPHHRKYGFDVIQMVGRYPGLEGATPEEEKYFKIGSYDELLARHLKTGRAVFDITMDMPFSEDRLKRLIGGQLRKTLFKDVSGPRRRALEAGALFYPLYVAARSFDEESQRAVEDVVVELSYLYMGETDAAQALVDAYRAYIERGREVAGGDADFVPYEFPLAEMSLVAGLKDVRSKNLRSAVLRAMPEEIAAVHSRGQTLDEQFAMSAEPGALHLLAWMIFGASASTDDDARSTVRCILERIDGLADVVEEEERAKMASALEQGLLTLFAEREGAAGFLAAHLHVLRDAGTHEMVRLIDTLGKIRNASPILFGEFMSSRFSSVAGITGLARDFEAEPYFTHLGIADNDENRARIAAVMPSGIDGFLMLVHNYAAAGYDHEIAIIKEAAVHVIAGDYDSWRAGRPGIEFLNEDSQFWSGFASPLRSRIILDEGAVDIDVELREAFGEMRDVLLDYGRGAEDRHRLEHAFVWRRIAGYLEIDSQRARKNYIGHVQGLIQALKRIEARVSAGLEVEVQDRQRLFSFGIDVDRNDPKARARTAYMLSRLSRWLEALSAAQEGIEDGSKRGIERALATLSHIAAGYKRHLAGEKDRLAQSLVQAVSLLKNRKYKAAGKEIVVEDSADWSVLLNSGRLHPDLINCLVPSGYPEQTRTLADLLASGNKRAVIARDAGTNEILSVGFLKVRSDSNGGPVLHLERPFGIKGAKFEAQMLDHIRSKRGAMGPAGQRAKITRQTKTKSERDAGLRVFSTGSAATFEYVEDLFGVRKSAEVDYHAHVVDAGAAAASLPCGGGSGAPFGPMMRWMPPPGVALLGPTQGIGGMFMGHGLSGFFGRI